MGHKVPRFMMGVFIGTLGKGIRIYELQLKPWIMGKCPQKYKFFPSAPDDVFILKGTFVFSIWPIMSSPLLLHVEPATPQALAGKVWYARPGQLPLPAVVLSSDEKLACILPKGQDLCLLVPLTSLSFCP